MFLRAFSLNTIEHSRLQPSSAWFHVPTVEGIWDFVSFSKHNLALGGFFPLPFAAG